MINRQRQNKITVERHNSRDFARINLYLGEIVLSLLYLTKIS